jgi:hypothetical protein
METAEGYTFLHLMEADLHDLCQPLTALQFQLECGSVAATPEALRSALTGGLAETTRMIDVVRRMREHILREAAAHR